MTPQEKGDELVNTFLKMEYGILQEYLPATNEIVATKCAIIAVEEIIKNKTDIITYMAQTSGPELLCYSYYWNEVLNYLKSKL